MISKSSILGDYLSREEKLAIIGKFGSIGGIAQADGWQMVLPDEHGDWLNQRDGSFSAFMALGNKKNDEATIFQNYSLGVVTNRDAWAYNPGRAALTSNMRAMISFYNAEADRFDLSFAKLNRKEREAKINESVSSDPTKISWTANLKTDLARGKRFDFDDYALIQSMYRPFTRQWLYYSRTFNERVLLMPRMFPMGIENIKNRVICVSNGGQKLPFSVMMSDSLPNLNFVDIEGNQCFPRFLFEPVDSGTQGDRQGDLLSERSSAVPDSLYRDAITDQGLSHFQSSYADDSITKDDLFYYVYGLLHSEDYRARFADNLSKQLPRIPALKKIADFRAFVEAGRKLGDLHCDYEQAECYPVTIAQGDLRLANVADPERFYRVEQMKFAGKRPKLNKSTIIYNANITMTGVPLEAYEYVVNGKPALEWVMERQCVKTDKASGIVNDANRYAIETIGNPAYPLELFQRVITVSLETMKIVKSLPPLGDLA